MENENYWEGNLYLDKTQVMVYFCLYGDEFPIDYVTETLETEPTKTYKKGEVIVRPHNPNVISTKTLYRKETAWELSTVYQESYDVKEQMDQILGPLKNKAAILNQVKAKYKLECKIFIVIIWKMEIHRFCILITNRLNLQIVLKLKLILICMQTLMKMNMTTKKAQTFFN